MRIIPDPDACGCDACTKEPATLTPAEIQRFREELDRTYQGRPRTEARIIKDPHA